MRTSNRVSPVEMNVARVPGGAGAIGAIGWAGIGGPPIGPDGRGAVIPGGPPAGCAAAIPIDPRTTTAIELTSFPIDHLSTDEPPLSPDPRILRNWRTGAAAKPAVPVSSADRGRSGAWRPIT